MSGNANFTAFPLNFEFISFFEVVRALFPFAF